MPPCILAQESDERTRILGFLLFTSCLSLIVDASCLSVSLIIVGFSLIVETFWPVGIVDR